jgi:alkylated DNA repair dioxygenase AlkB
MPMSPRPVPAGMVSRELAPFSTCTEELARFGPVVAPVSLSAACVMDFTRTEDGAKVAVWLRPGSLVVMTGPKQGSWRRSIAARESDPRRDGRLRCGR